jgi:hypothetical protein
MHDHASLAGAGSRTTTPRNVLLPDPADQDPFPGGTEELFPSDAEVAEVGLLLPGAQAAALERAARRRDLSVGQLLRRLVRDYLASEEQ